MRNSCIFVQKVIMKIITKEEVSIDWSKKGQLLGDSHGVYLVTDGYHTDTTFNATRLSDGASTCWSKGAFKPVKGQLIIENE